MFLLSGPMFLLSGLMFLLSGPMFLLSGPIFLLSGPMCNSTPMIVLHLALAYALCDAQRTNPTVSSASRCVQIKATPQSHRDLLSKACAKC